MRDAVHAVAHEALSEARRLKWCDEREEVYLDALHGICAMTECLGCLKASGLAGARVICENCS